jgi:hypothetical protein
MAGTSNSVRCLPTSALSRAEVKGDFGGSLMRQSSKVRVHAPIMEFTKSGSSLRHAARPKSANTGSCRCAARLCKLSKPNRPRTFFRTPFIAARSAAYALASAVVVQKIAAPVRSDNERPSVGKEASGVFVFEARWHALGMSN